MAKLREADFYYGAVLSALLNNGICPMLIEGGTDRQVYDFTTDDENFRLFVKYRSAPIETKSEDYFSWQFNFSVSDITEITEYLENGFNLSLGLVCGNTPLNQSQYAVIPKETLKELLQQGKTSLTISIQKGERAYRISIGGGRENALKVKTNAWY